MSASRQAERIVLGAAMLDARIVEQCADILRAEYFDSDLYRRAWAAVCALSDKGEAPILPAVKLEMERGGELPGVALADLAGLLDGLPKIGDATHWARQIREAARRRAVRAAAEKLAADVAAEAEDTDEILARHQATLEKLIRASELTHTVTIAKAVKEAMADLDKYISAPSGITGVPTGLPDFDNLTGGLQPGALTIIAARPRRGKSVFCCQTATYAASKGNRVLMFSLEMAPRQVAKRILMADAEVDRYSLRYDKSWAKLAAAVGRVSQLPIWLDDREAPTLGQIRAAVKRLHATEPVDLVVVDYLQRCSVDRKLDRHLAIGELVDGLKSMAMSMNLPVLAACQVGREGEIGKPTLAMMRESGSIEQTADIVAILHPHPMLGKTPDEIMELDFPQVDLWVEKHRDGAEMVIPLSFEKKLVRFVNLSRKPDAA